ncbi:MAG: EamA family transporter [Bacteroidia bacterium]|nr:EamA family transporter [Bacteroidia bacterium]
MFDLILCILLSATLLVLFRLFDTKKLNLLPIITINYFVCFFLSGLHEGSWNLFTIIPGNWLLLALFQGLLFISMFNLIGKMAIEIGMAYSTMIGKLSVIIPVLISFAWFGDPIYSFQWLGLCLALISIVLINYQPNQGITIQGLNPVLLFLGNGLIDTNFRIFQHYFSATVPETRFTLLLFFTAGTIGVIITSWKLAQKQLHWKKEYIIAGILLGVPNFYSVWFLVRGLKQLGGTTFFPLFNIGLLVFITCIGILCFQEKLPKLGWIGLGFAILAILCLSL